MSWKLVISKEDNGYILKGRFGDTDIESKVVIEDKDNNELDSGETLLWQVIEYFNIGGSRHDKERLRIVREPGTDYEATGLDNHIEEIT